MSTLDYSRIYLLDYDPDAFTTDIELFCILSISIHDFIAQKKKAYAATITSEMIDAQLAETYFAPGNFSEEEKKKHIRDSMITGFIKTKYNFYPVEKDPPKKGFRFIARSWTQGENSLSVNIGKHPHSKYYILRIETKEQDLLDEMSGWFSQPFRKIPREKLVEGFLSGHDQSARTLEILWEFAKDTSAPADDLLKVCKKALTIPDKNILEEITAQLWCDIAYEQGFYTCQLNTALEEFLQNSTLTQLIGEDYLQQAKDTLEAIKTGPVNPG